MKNSLLYVTRVRLPSTAAQSVQIMAMAQAYHQRLGETFHLVSGKGHLPAPAEMQSYWTIRDGSRPWLRYARFFVETFLRIASGRAVLLTRDIALALAAILAGGSAVYEAHKQPIGRGADLIWKALVHFRRFKVVAVSQALVDFYRGHYDIAEDRIILARNGVSLEKYGTFHQWSKEEVRESLGLPKNKLLVVHTGSLYKGGAELYEHVVKYAESDVFFIHVGGTVDQCLQWSKYYASLGDGIVFIPHAPQDLVMRYQRAADLLFYVTTRNSPEYWCTSPLKMFEYMATGIPILGARVGAVGEVLTEDVAYCFDPGEPASLRDAFQRFRQDGALAQQKADKARRQAVALYSWEKRAGEIIDFAFVDE